MKAINRQIKLITKIDQALKGMSSANPWDEISSLILELSGQNIPNLAYVN